MFKMLLDWTFSFGIGLKLRNIIINLSDFLFGSSIINRGDVLWVSIEVTVSYKYLLELLLLSFSFTWMLCSTMSWKVFKLSSIIECLAIGLGSWKSLLLSVHICSNCWFGCSFPKFSLLLLLINNFHWTASSTWVMQCIIITTLGYKHFCLGSITIFPNVFTIHILSYLVNFWSTMWHNITLKSLRWKLLCITFLIRIF